MDGPPADEIRQGRNFELEARLIAEAEAEADLGLLIPADEVNAWIESLGSSAPLRPPKPALRRS